jgi:hypothetical protein
MINSPADDNLSILLSLKERFRSDGSHDAIVVTRIERDERPRCSCGNLITISDVNFTCRECRVSGNLNFQHGDR